MVPPKMLSLHLNLRRNGSPSLFGLDYQAASERRTPSASGHLTRACPNCAEIISLSLD
nr:MAG TPA: hypothetical protein [Caudoviricetes sp.]